MTIHPVRGTVMPMYRVRQARAAKLENKMSEDHFSSQMNRPRYRINRTVRSMKRGSVQAYPHT
jgi:hypothetical protein